ncbi:MAG TPA: hypothetical protein VH951_13530 [Dehalococcoidia bacterium]
MRGDAEENPLREEEDFFETHRAEWLKEHRGQLALVKGRMLLGFYPTVDAAFREGLEKIGYQDMLIKDVLEEDPSSFIFS